MLKIRQNKVGEYLFSLHSGNGQELMYSEPYLSIASCNNAIESVRRNSLREEAFEKKTSSNGKFYFWLKAQNGQIMTTSGYYESENQRDNGIELVKKYAPDAKIKE